MSNSVSKGIGLALRKSTSNDFKDNPNDTLQLTKKLKSAFLYCGLKDYSVLPLIPQKLRLT